MNTLTLPVSKLKSFLNQALIFVNKTKLGIHPLYSCILLKEDKLYVYNGETGAIITLPTTFEKPTVVLPFDIGQVVNAARDESEVTLDLDYEDMVCKVKTENIKIKVKLIDPSTFKEPAIPDDLVLFEIENFYQKVRSAAFSCSIDASLPILQGIKFTKESVCATDQRGLWREQSENAQEFVLPKLLIDHVLRLGIEPTGLGISESQIFIFYPEIVMFGARLADDALHNKYPNIDKLLAEIIRKQEDAAVVSYDRDLLTSRLEALLSLPQHENAISVKCEGEILTASNMVGASTDTQGEINLTVASSAEFDSLLINGELFKNAVARFHSFKIKADQKRLLFSNETQEYCVVRRSVS